MLSRTFKACIRKFTQIRLLGLDSWSTLWRRIRLKAKQRVLAKKLTDLKGFFNRQNNGLITLRILQGNATAVGICQINLHQYRRKNKMILDWENKREWGLEQSGVLVTRLFFCSCSLRSFFSASILKVIATALNLPASVSAGSRSVESAPFCFPIAPTTRNLRAVMCVYRPIGLQ